MIFFALILAHMCNDASAQFIDVFCSQYLQMAGSEMNRSSCLTPTRDTRKMSNEALFLSRAYTDVKDPIHDGLCGYRAVAEEVGVLHQEVVQGLLDFAVKNGKHPTVKAAKKRWALVLRHVVEGTGVDETGWLNAREDCKYTYLFCFDLLNFDVYFFLLFRSVCSCHYPQETYYSFEERVFPRGLCGECDISA